MSITMNILSLFFPRLLGGRKDSNVMTTGALSGFDIAKGAGKNWRTGSAPPGKFDLSRLSAHLRRDIGLDFDRA